MLIFSEERYLPVKSGIITLDCPKGGYIYAGLKAYNSGVILSQSREYDSKEKLLALAKPKNVFRRKSIDDLYDLLPNPLKPLAYLLYLAEEEYKEFSEQVGALNIILQFVYPTYWFATPKEQRMDVSFGSSIKAEYEYDRRVFFDNCIKYDDIVNPKESKERFPIYVINASYAENPFAAGKTNYENRSGENIDFNENGDAVIDIDFDSLPDIEDNNEKNENEEMHEAEASDYAEPPKTDIDEAYAKLLS